MGIGMKSTPTRPAQNFSNRDGLSDNKKMEQMTAWDVPGEGIKTRGQGELSYPQESHGKSARMNILVKVVTSLAETVASGATGKQKLWKLYRVN